MYTSSGERIHGFGGFHGGFGRPFGFGGFVPPFLLGAGLGYYNRPYPYYPPYPYYY